MYSTHSSFIRSGATLVASLLTAAAIAPVRSALTVHAAGDRPFTSAEASSGATARAVTPLGGLPLHFEPRDLAGTPAFVARGQGYNVAVTAQGATVSLAGRDGRRAEVGFAVAGGAGAADLEGDAPLPGVVHRYVGDRTGWQPGLRTYGRVVASHVRPGIDVVYYGNQRQLEYDFVIAPGASPADAGMIVSGADRVEIDVETGDLLVHVGDRVLRQRAPVAYQERAGVRTPIASAFTWDAGANRVGFTVGEYDRTRALVIDPVLVYSSWFGGESEEVILAMKVDADGFIYVLGYSADKAGFPTTPGAFQPQRAGTPTGGGLYPVDYFVSKFNPAGSALVYSTLIGGSGDEATWFYTPGGLDVRCPGAGLHRRRHRVHRLPGDARRRRRDVRARSGQPAGRGVLRAPEGRRHARLLDLHRRAAPRGRHRRRRRRGRQRLRRRQDGLQQHDRRASSPRPTPTARPARAATTCSCSATRRPACSCTRRTLAAARAT